MKRIIAALLVLGGCQFAHAADTLFDFGGLFSSARAGYAINQDLEKSEIFYTAIQSYHQGDIELINLDAGYEALNKCPLLALNVRLDNIIPRLWGSDWGKAHISTAKLPTIEFGPFLSGWPIRTTNGYRIEMSYGISVAIGFAVNGGK
jgi:hypothetical protein